MMRTSWPWVTSGGLSMRPTHAVNAAVVVNVVGIVIANLVITQLQTMFFPMQVA